MKRQVTISGISHRTGNSRSGEKYDFYQLHGTYSDEATEGLATISVVIPDNEVPNVEVGKTVMLFSHFYNGKEYFDAMM